MSDDWKQKALDKLKRDGWRQGISGDRDAPCCAGGAIAWAITGDPRDMYSDSEEHERVLPALQEFIEVAQIPASERGWFDEDPIIDWNDAPQRTEEEVLSAFEKLTQAA